MCARLVLMADTLERDFEADDGTPLLVYITVESYGYPGNAWDDPGEGPELGVDRAEHRETGEPFDLTDAERARMEQAVCEEPGLGDDYPDDSLMIDDECR